VLRCNQPVPAGQQMLVVGLTCSTECVQRSHAVDNSTPPLCRRTLTARRVLR
jgi:hypothetical protein